MEGLELHRFLVTLDQTVKDMPGARVTFVELDALLAQDPAFSVDSSGHVTTKTTTTFVMKCECRRREAMRHFSRGRDYA